MDGYLDDEQSKPRLLDWKIEMNPRKEYTDPIRISYTYAGGVEGQTIIQWCREAAPEDTSFIHRTEDGFVPLMVGTIFRTPKYPHPSSQLSSNHAGRLDRDCRARARGGCLLPPTPRGKQKPRV